MADTMHPDFLALTEEESNRLLALGNNPYGLKEGMEVVRTEDGENNVKFPANGTNQKAIVLKVYEEWQVPTLQVWTPYPYNGLIMCSLEDHTRKVFAVDLSWYKPA